MQATVENRLLSLPLRSVTKNLKSLIPFFSSSKIKTVLDYGAGTLRNTCYLLRNGFKVYIAETGQQLPKVYNHIETNYVEGIYDVDDLSHKSLGVDLVISNFVLNIIEDEIEKEKLIDNVFHNLRDGGYFLVEVRNKKCKNTCSRADSCNKELSLEDLDRLIIPKGYKRVKSLVNGIALAVMYQKVKEKNNFNLKGKY